MEALTELREELPPTCRRDPYLVLPSGDATSRDVYSGQLLSPDEVVPALLPRFRGLRRRWTLRRGYLHPRLRRLCRTAPLVRDRNLPPSTTPSSLKAGQAVKGTYAGRRVGCRHLQRPNSPSSKRLLAQMGEQPRKALERGQYRTFLAPSAVADLVSHAVLGWH